MGVGGWVGGGLGVSLSSSGLRTQEYTKKSVFVFVSSFYSSCELHVLRPINKGITVSPPPHPAFPKHTNVGLLFKTTHLVIRCYIPFIHIQASLHNYVLNPIRPQEQDRKQFLTHLNYDECGRVVYLMVVYVAFSIITFIGPTDDSICIPIQNVRPALCSLKKA